MALSGTVRRASGFPLWVGRLTRVFAALGLGFVLAFLLGFLRFAHSVISAEPPENASADAIVALTGGASRIQDAVQLLAEGRGRRLLITGVNPSTTRRELARHVPGSEPLFDCCVDLDWRAINTIGNAEEAQKWAEHRGFRSLIIVTSSYHMPRSLAELNRAMPDVTLVPYPVSVERLRDGVWWRDTQAARLLLGEYVKYMAALARMTVEPSVPEAPLVQAAHQPRR